MVCNAKSQIVMEQECLSNSQANQRQKCTLASSSPSTCTDATAALYVPRAQPSPLDVVCFDPSERNRLHAFLHRRHGSSCRNILKVIIKVYSIQGKCMDRMVYAVLCRGLLALAAANLLRQRGGMGFGRIFGVPESTIERRSS